LAPADGIACGIHTDPATLICSRGQFLGGDVSYHPKIPPAPTRQKQSLKTSKMMQFVRATDTLSGLALLYNNPLGMLLSHCRMMPGADTDGCRQLRIHIITGANKGADG
jgi:hypothetical protein